MRDLGLLEGEQPYLGDILTAYKPLTNWDDSLSRIPLQDFGGQWNTLLATSSTLLEMIQID